MGVIPKNGNWYIDYRLANGKRRREKVGKSKKLAETIFAKRKIEIAESRFLDKKKTTNLKFEVFADEYLDLHCKINNKKSWMKADRHNIKKLKSFFSGKLLTEITPHLVEQFKAKRTEDILHGKSGQEKKISPTTVNRQLACLKSIFNKAIAWEKFDGKNPVKGVKLFKENNQRLRFLEEDEILKLIANSQEPLKSIIIVALNTGMRRGEIMGLKWQDIDFKREIIYLFDTKNGEKREIPMNENVTAALIGIRKHPQSEYIFIKENGRPYGDFKKSFFTACKKSVIKGFRFHDLRHTFASHLVMSGVDLNSVRELLGHKSLAMTLRYSHLSPSHKKHAVDILGKKLDTFWTPKAEHSKTDDVERLISSLNSNNLENLAGVAQLVEQLTCNQ